MGTRGPGKLRFCHGTSRKWSPDRQAEVGDHLGTLRMPRKNVSNMFFPPPPTPGACDVTYLSPPLVTGVEYLGKHTVSFILEISVLSVLTWTP